MASARLRSLLTPPGVVTVTVVLAAGAKALAERLGENDLWWHLRAGEIVVAERGLPAGDPFSYTSPGAPWVVQHWLGEVLLHAIESLAGLRGVVVWRAVMLLAIYGLLAGMFRRDAGRGWPASITFALAAAAGSRGWVERPSLFSLLMFVLVLRSIRGSRPWLAVPATAVWANLHGMVIMGLGLVALVAAAEWASVALGHEASNRARARKVSLVALGCVVAALVNPYGPRLLTYAFELVGAVQSTAAEWASPDFHETIPLLFLVLAAVCVVALGLARDRSDPVDVAIAAVFIALGVYSERNLALSAAAVGLVTARAMGSVGRPGRGASPERAANPAVGATALVAVVAVLVAVVVPRFPRSNALRDVADPRYPVAAVESLPSSSVRLFADDRWAGLALYARWPGLCVAFDGRGDFYGPEGIQRYRDTIAGGPGAVRYLDDQVTTHVLVEAASGLARTLEGAPGWRILRRDPIGGETAVLFTRDGIGAPPACAAAPLEAG